VKLNIVFSQTETCSKILYFSHPETTKETSSLGSNFGHTATNSFCAKTINFYGGTPQTKLKFSILANNFIYSHILSVYKQEL
jgi:hypothetical protein